MLRFATAAERLSCRRGSAARRYIAIGGSRNPSWRPCNFAREAQSDRRSLRAIHAGFRGEVATQTASRVSYLVAEVQRAGSFEGTDQVELYVLGWEVVEQPATLPQEYRPQLDVDQIKYAGLQALLRGVGTVQHNVAVTSCCFRLLHARLDAVGDVMNPLEGVLRRWLVSRDEDRHAVVVVAAPVTGKVSGPSPGDDCAAGHRLLEDDLAVRVARPEVIGSVAALLDSVEPIHQTHAVDSGRILGVVVRPGDEAVQGHRHGQEHLRHRSSSRSSTHRRVGGNRLTRRGDESDRSALSNQQLSPVLLQGARSLPPNRPPCCQPTEATFGDRQRTRTHPAQKAAGRHVLKCLP